jgi:transcriptional regulator with XRE-family HTH domain
MRTRTRNRLIAATVAKDRLVALGLAVIEAREQKGMSVAELAEAVGFKRRRLVRIEAGELDPRYDGLIALADGLGVRVAAIMPPDAPSTDRRRT